MLTLYVDSELDIWIYNPHTGRLFKHMPRNTPMNRWLGIATLDDSSEAYDYISDLTDIVVEQCFYLDDLDQRYRPKEPA